MVTCNSMCPKSRRRNRSVVCSCVGVRMPRVVEPRLVVIACVSTTNVSPSHLPMEYPNQAGVMSAREVAAVGEDLAEVIELFVQQECDAGILHEFHGPRNDHRVRNPVRHAMLRGPSRAKDSQALAIEGFGFGQHRRNRRARGHEVLQAGVGALLGWDPARRLWSASTTRRDRVCRREPLGAGAVRLGLPSAFAGCRQSDSGAIARPLERGLQTGAHPSTWTLQTSIHRLEVAPTCREVPRNTPCEPGPCNPCWPS